MKIDVFIEKVSSFLPNNPIGNEEMEEYLGLIEGKPSRVKNLVLKQNGIQRRYYALNKNQEITHTNAELAAMAIRGIFKEEGDLANVELMTTATSIPDQILPSHASMVHGLLPELGNIEIFSTAGVCLTSLQALKIAYLAVAVGDKENAICSASELVSATLLSKHYDAEYEKCHSIGENPYFGFEKDFLRFMLSDGAGAVLLGNKPNDQGLSFKIEWIDMQSYANECPVCMLAGGEFNLDGSTTSWKMFENKDFMDKSIFAVKQDIRLLKRYNLSQKKFFLIKAKSLLKENGVIFLGFPAWQMPFGGHQQICKNKIVSHLPFIHLLPSFLYKTVLKLFGENSGCIKELLSIKQTKITIELFEGIIAESNVNIVDRCLWFINPHYKQKFNLKPRRIWGILENIKYVRNFFCTSCFYIIK